MRYCSCTFNGLLPPRFFLAQFKGHLLVLEPKVELGINKTTFYITF